MKVALLAGSTGLIGSYVLELLINHPGYSKVIALSRKPLSLNHEKLKNIVADFDSLNLIAADLRADDVFCCLGTTIKKVGGSKDAFRKVDYEYPFNLAALAKHEGAQQFLLVSALGANKDSTIFYNHVKGEVEQAIGELSFDTFRIFRPSLLMGDRKEKRFGEDAGKLVTKYLGWMIPKKYRGIEAKKVARAMVELAQSKDAGRLVYESDLLQNY